MPLQPGTTLGPYTVTAQIGAGGMGEVYRARDTKLDRDVALKVLPDAFTADPDRLARFEREAKVLASLNHPNIASIYVLEEAEGTKALVLELVEGPTLADRIAEGPISIDDALPIAKQIAEALEGTQPWRFSNFRKNRAAARRLRLDWTNMSRTLPSSSTARHRYCWRPFRVTNSSSRCHVSPRRPRRCRSRRAYARPNVRHHRRIVS